METVLESPDRILWGLASPLFLSSFKKKSPRYKVTSNVNSEPRAEVSAWAFYPKLLILLWQLGCLCDEQLPPGSQYPCILAFTSCAVLSSLVSWVLSAVYCVPSKKGGMLALKSEYEWQQTPVVAQTVLSFIFFVFVCMCACLTRGRYQMFPPMTLHLIFLRQGLSL